MFELQVTREHIVEAMRQRREMRPLAYCCPVAIACQEKFKTRNVGVGLFTINVAGFHKYKHNAQHEVALFDARHDLHPFTVMLIQQ